MARKTGSDGKKTATDLRAAATALFAKHGFAAVSMRQIAQKVGVQAGALYLYTPNKQALLFDIMQQHLDGLLGAWETEKLPDSATPLAQLQRFVSFHIHYHLDRADEVFIAYMELRNLLPENLATISETRRRYELVLEGILAAGQKTGDFQISDCKLSSYAIIAMLTGMTTWYRDQGRLSLAEIEQVYQGLVYGAVSGAKTKS